MIFELSPIRIGSKLKASNSKLDNNKRSDSKSGFSRLKSLSAASLIGVAGLLGGGSVRAASTPLDLTVIRGGVNWEDIDNNSNFPSSSDVTTTNGAFYSTETEAFGINDASITASDTGDAFDNALQLAVDGNLFINPDATVDLTGDTVTSDVVSGIVPGIDAQIQYQFFPGRPVVRGLFSLTNTTGASIAVDPVILSDYGSDQTTTVQATSDGDTVIENSDFWYITDDDDESDTGDAFDSDPRITTTRYGAGAAVVPLNALTPDDSAPAIAVSGLRYPVTIPAGETRRIMVFMEVNDPTASVASAVASAADFASTAAAQSAGLLVGLSPTQINEIINYVGTIPSAQAVPVLTPIGLLGLIGLLGGAGFFELRRRKQS